MSADTPICPHCGGPGILRGYCNAQYLWLRRHGLLPPIGPGRRGDPEGHAEAGRIGGSKTASDRTHMQRIGRKGAAAYWAARRAEEEEKSE